MRSICFRALRSFWPACVILPTLLAAGLFARSAAAQEEPVAVIGFAGIDRLLEDVDYVFEAAGQPQHAEMIRGVIANFNELRGLDRGRPVGMSFYFPSAGKKDPRPLLFFPVADVDELLSSVRLGNALRLERTDVEDRLTLHTEEGELPVRLEHGYAFLDPTRSTSLLSQPLTDPQTRLESVLQHHDAAIVIQRKGIPPFLFEVAAGQLRAEAVKNQQQKETESDEEYALRREVTDNLLSLAESVLKDWQSATLGLQLSAEDRRAEWNVAITMASDGESSHFLKGIAGAGTKFRPQLEEVSALALSTNWQPTQAGRDILGRLLTTFRQQLMQQVAQADEEVQSAVQSVLDAVDATADGGQFDAYVRLAGAPPNSFVLVGGAAVAEAEKLAAGLERLLPFAEDSKDIRSVEMAIARAGDVAMHRMWPRNLRKQDRRLYGDVAAIYLAAGEGAFWFAIGDVGAIDVLTDAIEASPPADSPVLARPRESTSALPAGPALLSLTLHASDWVAIAQPNGGQNVKLAELVRQAFENPDEDRFHFRLTPAPDGLHLHVSLDHGYVRLFGLALSAGMQQN